MTKPPHREQPPTPRDAALARSSGPRLARYLDAERSLSLHIRHAGEEEAIELPAGAVRLRMDILETMATGRGLTLLPENAELTTVQAAAVLNVSRPFLIELL
ncbi:MAG: DNA-binding protein, partial [Trueperaceae bacterium]|nr:DNA-binding protein [Trueperaceae bacterium]